MEAAMNVQLRKIGNSVGVILPKELLGKHDLAEGDTLAVVNTPDGIKLVKADAEFEEQMAYARRGMQKYRNTLRKLAE